MPKSWGRVFDEHLKATGTGSWSKSRRAGGRHGMTKECRACGGNGRVMRIRAQGKCTRCDGTGSVRA